MQKYKYYEDFIGLKLKVEFQPFTYTSLSQVLKAELWRLIKNNLTYSNGLLCNFDDMKVEIINNKLIAYGTVTECEVDC